MTGRASTSRVQLAKRLRELGSHQSAQFVLAAPRRRRWFRRRAATAFDAQAARNREAAYPEDARWRQTVETEIMCLQEAVAELQRRLDVPRRAASVDEQHLQDVASRVGCEQILNALTPPYKRNPTSIAKALAEDGYAVYDGPVQPSKGSGDNQ